MTPRERPARAGARPVALAAARAGLSSFHGFLVLLGLSSILACGGGAGEDAGETVAAELRVYTVRGVLRSLPEPESERPEILVRHEAIDDFVGVNGEVVGMDSMSMPFPLASGLDLTGIAPGDKVMLRLEVDWSADEPARVTAIDKLDPESELEFRAARP